MTWKKVTVEAKGVVESKATEQTGKTSASKVSGGCFQTPFVGSHIIRPIEEEWEGIPVGRRDNAWVAAA